MTACKKCHHYHWDEIVIWRCGNLECAELYPDTNSDEKEKRDSVEFLKELKDLTEQNAELVMALDYVERYCVDDKHNIRQVARIALGKEPKIKVRYSNLGKYFRKKQG